MKTLALLAASVLTLVVGWFASDSPDTPSGMAFGDVLQRLNEADVLLLQVTRDGATAEVTIRRPGMLRWEDGSGQYRIARGNRLWQVNADVAVTSLANPWFGPDGGIDLLALASVRPDDRASLLAAQPTALGEYAGRRCLVYRRSVTSDGRSLRVEAFVDAESRQLAGLTARDPQAPPTAPPLAEIRLLALNPVVAEDQFRIPVQLAAGDRIGTVTDLQGIVTLRAVGARRWTPLGREMLIQPGDWIRTDVRGANAATVELVSQQRLVVGPGSLVEIISPHEARLHSGTLQVKRTEQTPNDFRLRGAGDSERTLLAAGASIYDLDRAGRLQELQAAPPWLRGYAGTSAEDSIGSLIVQIDGRDVPLTVGEHHVTVEIRDQIARTTIEETFVNTTNRRTEGTFHFPLPQDASISGFGMWIGDELVEADIVEKQRAREIYETILREKRDPGLLEWTGGNIFKARVFPIEAQSEKRVKIVYTQVLPLRGNRFRYSYGLQSELLSLHPLRELNVRVQVSSAVPLTSVESPTHTCRSRLTPHAAELEFTAQDYTPTKDFEVVCQVNHRENDVVAIPHRRGDDGYFLLQLMPPGGDGNWQRARLPDGDPLELLLLCDTSGSMDRAMRRTQAEFTAAVLASLGDKDRFNLALCDVDTVWAFDEFTAATDETTAQARQILGERISLGWTDLDRAFAEVLKRTSPRTQVIYIGDGIVATTDSDPAAFVNRLRRLWEERGFRIQDRGSRRANAGPAADSPDADRTRSEQRPLNPESSILNPPTFHAVSVGSAYESVVLKGFAALNGGSTRQIGGETTPQQAALDLLSELAQPGLKDVRIEFRGLQVAAVYPESLPNVAPGTQQILVGRYLPEGRDQSGEIVVTGTQNGEPVRYIARIALPNAEAGNSFIPRLWARARLDQLLHEGASPQIQAEMIRLSEEFHIITPYTSLLVLESDADRERFKVQRRLEIRDGERYFAAGRDAADFALRRQQMQNAGNRRLGLRRHLLAELAALGRDASVFEAVPQAWNGTFRGNRLAEGVTDLGEVSRYNFGFAGGLGGATWDFRSSGGVMIEPSSAISYDKAFGGPSDVAAEYDVLGRLGEDVLSEEQMALVVARTVDEFAAMSDGPRLLFEDAELAMPAEPGLFGMLKRAEADGTFDAAGEYEFFRKQPAQQTFADRHRGLSAALPQLSIGFDVRDDFGLLGRPSSGTVQAGQQVFFSSHGAASPLSWVNDCFPPLAAAPGRTDEREQESMKTAAPGWSDEALELSRSLLRDAALRDFAGGVRVERQSQHWDSNWDRLVRGGERLELWSQPRWLTRDYGQGVQPIVNWCDAQQRGVYSEAFLLGRQRQATAEDLVAWPLEPADDSLTPLHESFRTYQAGIERPADDRAVLVAVHPGDPQQVRRITIDTARHVLLKVEYLSQGRLQSTTEHSEFVEVAGRWWATKIVSTTAGVSHPGSVTTQSVTALAADEFNSAFAAELSRRPAVQFLNLPLPEVPVAKLSVQSGRADFDDRFALLLHHAATQQWEPVFEQLRALEEPSAGKSGLPWVRVAVEMMAGRNAEALQGLVQLAPVVVRDPASPTPGLVGGVRGTDMFLAEHLLGRAYPITAWSEYAPLVATLKPVYERQAEQDTAFMEWREQQLRVLSALGRSDEAIAWAKDMAAAQPGNPQRQIDYAQRLVDRSRDDEALAFLREQMAKDHWEPGELYALKENYADRLENRGRWAEWQTFLTEWLATNPAESGPHARYLTALVMTDDVATADATVLAWLALVRKEGELTTQETVRVETAIQFALGNGHHLYRYSNMDPKWRQPLLETALACIPREDRHQFAQSFVDNGRFDQTDAGDRLRGHLLGGLLDGVGTLSLQRLQDQLSWLQRGRLLVGEGDTLTIRQVTDAEWSQLADGVLARWDVETDVSLKHRLGQILSGLYAGHLTDRRVLFARRLTTDGPELYRTEYRAELFSLLLEQPWSEANETEAFAIWPTITQAETTFERLMVLIPALYRFVDTMIAARIAAAERRRQDAGNVDELTRSVLAARQAENRQAAREGVAARLAVADAAGIGDAALLPWVQIERIYLDVLLDRNRDDVLAKCWATLGDAPPQFDPQREFTAEELAYELLTTLLRQRAWTTVVNLAARRNADAALIDRVLAYVDAGIAGSRVSGGPQPPPGDQGDKVVDPDAQPSTLNTQLPALNAAWKQTKYDLLILLDRPDDLAASLRDWIRTGQWTIPWRLALARLQVERGELQEAIELLEGVRKNHELAPADHQTLADCYLVMDRRADYERSRIEAFKAMEERQLSNFLRSKSNELSSGGPHELDETALFATAGLFEKTSSPGGHFWLLRELYRSTQDFRLLARIPESTLGRTRQQVYEALNQLSGSLVQEVRKEATTDEMLAHLKKLRTDIAAGVVPRGADPNARSQALDLRSLDLMEALVERKAAEVLNQPGPHVQAALAALQRAFDRDWQDGERLQMATFLKDLGHISVAELAAEQARELKQLYDDSEVGSHDRARIGHAYAYVLFHSLGQRENGLAVAEMALREIAEAGSGHVPDAAADLVKGYSALLQATGAYAQAEQYVERQSAGAATDDVRLTYTEHLNELHNAALHAMGRTSLGEGETLFRNLISRVLDQCSTPDKSRRYYRLSLLLQVYEHGCERKFPTATQDLTAFTRDTLPELLTPLDSEYAQIVNQATDVLDRKVSAAVALDFLLTRVEHYPPRFEYEWRTAWSQHGGKLAELRSRVPAEAAERAALEERLLPIVLAELRRDLSSGESRDVGVYTLGHSYYWEAQQPAFIRTANEVLAAQRDAPRTHTYVAMYLHDRIHEFNRGIEVLFAAHRRGLLDDAGVDQLIDYLHRNRRYAESVALLEAAIDRQPDRMDLRARLIEAYHATERPQQVTELIEATDKHFHADGRWTEDAIYRFAQGCALAGHHERAAGYFEEAIHLRQLTAPNRGIGDGTLSSYYQHLAGVYSNLGLTKQAADAAAGAIISWGSDPNNRRQAFNALRDVLSAAMDLDAYVEGLDAEVRSTGADSPIIRKALGLVYQAKNDRQRAIVQLQKSLDLQPGDLEVHQALLACYDAAGDSAGAVRQLLAQIDVDRHSLELYAALAARTKSDASLSERAATSMVESAPGEAESHQVLAKFRQQQDRWDEAVTHWRRAAELRPLEPTGLLGLAEAQLHQRQWPAAHESLKALERRDWPVHFGDVEQQVRHLRERLPRE